MATPVCQKSGFAVDAAVDFDFDFNFFIFI